MPPRIDTRPKVITARLKRIWPDLLNTESGGYAVQPESHPPVKVAISSITATGGTSQYDSAFSRGNAMSRAPICNGTTKLPKPPSMTATATATIAIPCRLIAALYVSSLNSCMPALASSMRMSIATSPAIKNSAMNVTMYWTPITLWSVEKPK